MPLLLPVLAACRGPQSMLDPAGPSAQAIAAVWWWMLVTAVLNASWAFSSPSESDLIFGLRAVLTGAVGTAGLLMGFSMLPDTIEYDRLTTGHDRAGLYTGLLGFLEKNAYAFGPLLIGFYFSAAGVTKAGEHFFRRSTRRGRAHHGRDMGGGIVHAAHVYLHHDL